jgi:hypothetical protein
VSIGHYLATAVSSGCTIPVFRLLCYNMLYEYFSVQEFYCTTDITFATTGVLIPRHPYHRLVTFVHNVVVTDLQFDDVCACSLMVVVPCTLKR